MKAFCVLWTTSTVTLIRIHCSYTAKFQRSAEKSEASEKVVLSLCELQIMAMFEMWQVVLFLLPGCMAHMRQDAASSIHRLYSEVEFERACNWSSNTLEKLIDASVM